MRQDDLHEDMIGRKHVVRRRYDELQQQLDDRLRLRDQLRLHALQHIQQLYTTHSLTHSLPPFHTRIS